MSNKGIANQQLTKDEWKKTKELINSLRDDQDIAPFLIPVLESNLPKDLKTNYKAAIKKPMDIKTISSKLRKKQYKGIKEVHSDVMKIWKNAQTFNTDDSVRISHLIPF